MIDSGGAYAAPRLGTCKIPSPLPVQSDAGSFFVDDETILVDDRVSQLTATSSQTERPAFELAGPRREIFFDPNQTKVGIVTCGGLCPGVNDVIRGLVMQSFYGYGIRTVLGFRYGFQGCVPGADPPPMHLTPDSVSDITAFGGSLLGTSRGPQPVERIVDQLEAEKINIMFTIGGDGTTRGALAIAAEVERRGLTIAIVGIPKTIDNDVQFIDRSFGFETAVSEAVEAIIGAHTEARGVLNGIGIVKLMGRYSGFIACEAALATSQANFVLIPEVKFDLDGPGGLLQSLRERLERRRHAVIVIAEGAGQRYFGDALPTSDASGNRKLFDIGPFLVDRISKALTAKAVPFSIKYIDPSYLLRSVTAVPPDAVYCRRLAQHAVHAAMAGRTRVLIGEWHGRLVHVPMQLAVAERKQVDPDGPLWLSVLEATGQRREFRSADS